MIRNDVDEIVVNGSSSADTIENTGKYVTVNAGAGNDKITNDDGDNSEINGGDGNDSVYAFDNDYVTVNGSNGADTVEGVYYSSELNGGAGDDIVEVELAEGSTVDGGEGKDIISGVFVSSEINGGTGNDLITLQIGEENESTENTVAGGKGNDTIVNEVTAMYEDEAEAPGNVFQYAQGDGNDLIQGIGVNDTLHITSGTISDVQIDDEDVVLTIGTGKITLEGAAGKTIWLQKGNNDAEEYSFNGGGEEDSNYIELTERNDSYSNSRDGVTIAALAGNDTLSNYGNEVSINAGAGADYVYTDAENVIVEGGAGNDTLKNDTMALDGADNTANRGYNVTLDGGDGNDSIISCGATDVSINGGAGNDFITGDLRSATTVTGGKGNDTLDLVGTGYGSGRIIQYENGDGKDIVTGYREGDEIIIDDDYTTSISGNDWIIKVGSGSITLKDAASQTVVINGEEIEPPAPTPAGWKFSSNIATATLTAADNLDLNESYGEDITKVNGAKLTSGVVIIGNDLDNSIKSGSGNDTLDGGTEGDDTLTGGKGNDIFIYRGGNDIITDYGTGNDTVQIAIDDIEELSKETIGANVVVNVNGSTLTLQKASGKEFTFIDSAGNFLDFPEGPVTISGSAKADKLTNDEDEVVIDALAGNDTITNYGNKVTIIGGKGNDTIVNEGDGNIYEYATGDGKDVIVGFGENDTLLVTKGNYTYDVSGNDFIVKVGSGTITLKDAAGQTVYLNDETIEPELLPEGWIYSNTKKTGLKATLASAEPLNLNESYGEGVVSVDGSKITGGAEIIGNDEGNSIKAGKGEDVITGGKGDDTISLGGGADVYIYQGGDDVILDYKTGENDSIQLNGAEFINASVKGNDIIFSTSEGNITVKNGNKQSAVTLYDENGDQVYPTIDIVPEGWKKDSAKSLLQATIKSAETEIDLNDEDYGADVTKVDSTKITGDVVITANNLGNSIKTGAGNDIITSGEGGDTLTGGRGDDIYIYNGGDDLITDYGTGNDTVKIDVNTYSFETVGTDFVITTNVGTLTVKNGKTKNVLVVNSDDEQIHPEPDPIPDGWTVDSTKRKLTATIASAEDLDLNEDYGDGITIVDASKTSAIQVIGNEAENSIKAGKGNDTISGGGGNDTVSLGGGADVYIYQGGDDVILDYTAGADSIQINTGDVTFDPATGVSTIGQNVIISTEQGNLTVNKGSGKVITIIDQNGEQIYPEPDPLPSGWKYDSTHKQIHALVTSPDDLDLSERYGDGVTVVDASKAKSGVNIIGNDQNNSIKGSKSSDTINGGDGNDTVSLGGGADVYNYGGGDDVILDYVSGTDSIQIDTGNIEPISKTVSGTNVIIATSEGNITVTKGSTKNIIVMDQDGVEIPFDDDPTLPGGWKYDTAKTLVTATLSSPDDLDLNENYGKDVIKVDGSKALTVNIIGNDLDNSIKGSKNDDVIAGGSGNDTVSLGGGADVYIYSGGDDFIHDYVAGTDSIQVNTGDVTFTAVETVGSNLKYTTNNGTLILKGGKGKNITLMDENGEPIIYPDPDPTPEGWKFDTNKTTMTATIKSAENIDLTEPYGETIEKVDAVKVTGGVEIVANKLNNSIKGGSGADIISGGSGNDTVSLGGGADIYIYTEGDDTIQDYATVDAIQFENEILSSSLSGSNVVISTEYGTVTVIRGKDKNITVTDTTGEYTFKNIIEKDGQPLPEGLSYNTAKTVLTASTAFSEDTIDLSEYSNSSAVTKIDASKLKSDVSIIGNDLGNSIKAGSGDDTLLGGEGNDTLTGGNGDDLFIYNGGNDIITDYKAGQDSIQINTRNIDVEGISTVGTNVVIATELGNITVKNGRGKDISLFDQNGDELWFDEGGNFVNANNSDSLSDLIDTGGGIPASGEDIIAEKPQFGRETDVENPDLTAYYSQNENK